MLRLEFRAMNTDCLILLHPLSGGNAEGDLRRAEASVREYECRFSRFLSSSDLAHLNDDREEHVYVSSELAALLSRGLQYAQLTGGTFDPVVLADIRDIGYDRTFDEVPSETHASASSTPRRFRWTDMQVDEGCALVSRPKGAMVDLGGLAKGAAADLALSELAGHAGALVDLGGDIRTGGEPDDAPFWFVAMDDGYRRSLDTIGLADAAIATSSTRKRSFLKRSYDAPITPTDRLSVVTR
ncbi:MAG: FAD:protein FMN transferase [Deltaproteobacteria bacterium]|nr:MAG: FAD:protein FMN transferase [Deltaproteobacteria bacterium]